MTAKWSRWRYLEARFVTILTIRFKGALVPAWPADRSPTRTGPVEADGAVDAQNAPTAPWKTLLVFHELPQGFPHPITHDKPRKSPESYWETRIDPKISPGDYVMPCARDMKEMGSPEFIDTATKGPVAFVTVLPNGPMTIGKSLGMWFGYCLLVGVVAGYAAGLRRRQ